MLVNEVKFSSSDSTWLRQKTLTLICMLVGNVEGKEFVVSIRNSPTLVRLSYFRNFAFKHDKCAGLQLVTIVSEIRNGTAVSRHENKRE